MTSNTKTVIAFDLYGTLLSTESIAKELATHFGDEKAQGVAVLWRRYQLEYTWRLNSMSIYKPFSAITEASLKHALADSSLSLPDPAIASLMKAYDSLGVFPDVPPALKALSSSPNLEPYVFSNGTDAMVTSSVTQSPSLAPYAKVFKGLITVQELGVFKPDPRVYRFLVEKVGKGQGKEIGDVWLVSGNPFDVVGARTVGMQAAWVDRAGKGWVDGLGDLVGNGCGPTIVVNGVEGAVRGIEKWVEENKGRSS